MKTEFRVKFEEKMWDWNGIYEENWVLNGISTNNCKVGTRFAVKTKFWMEFGRDKCELAKGFGMQTEVRVRFRMIFEMKAELSILE